MNADLRAEHRPTQKGVLCAGCGFVWPCRGNLQAQVEELQKGLVLANACANGKALEALQALMDVTGARNWENPWLGVTSAVALLVIDVKKEPTKKALEQQAQERYDLGYGAGYNVGINEGRLEAAETAEAEPAEAESDSGVSVKSTHYRHRRVGFNPRSTGP